MKALLAEMESENPQVRQSLLAALGNVVPSHLMDQKLLTKGNETAPSSPSSGLIDVDVLSLRAPVT